MNCHYREPYRNVSVQEHNSWTTNNYCKTEMFTSAFFSTNVAAQEPNLIWQLLICSLSLLAKQDLCTKSLPTDCVQNQFLKMRACKTVLLTLVHPPVTPWTPLQTQLLRARADSYHPPMQQLRRVHSSTPEKITHGPGPCKWGSGTGVMLACWENKQHSTAKTLLKMYVTRGSIIWKECSQSAFFTDVSKTTFSK